MQIAYSTTFNAEEINHWSGTPYFMAKAFQRAGHHVHYVGRLKHELPAFFKVKQLYKKYLCGQRESPRFNIHAAKYYAYQTAKKLKRLPHDLILAPLISPIAYLDTAKPIILWTDALYAGLLGFYEPFSSHSANTIRQATAMTEACLGRCHQIIFSSDWAANTAIEIYGMDKKKIKVLPFGANLHESPRYEDIEACIKLRRKKPVRLLFLAKSWSRKGGDICLKVANALHDRGLPVELHIVGIQPPRMQHLPAYVHCHGFIAKNTPNGRAKLEAILKMTHFLLLPSRAEAYGIVFCEANAYGIPCLTTHVGGISTIVKNHINGFTYPVDGAIDVICNDIINITNSESGYSELVKSSFNEFQTR